MYCFYLFLSVCVCVGVFLIRVDFFLRINVLILGYEFPLTTPYERSENKAKIKGIANQEYCFWLVENDETLSITWEMNAYILYMFIHINFTILKTNKIHIHTYMQYQFLVQKISRLNLQVYESYKYISYLIINSDNIFDEISKLSVALIFFNRRQRWTNKLWVWIPTQIYVH